MNKYPSSQEVEIDLIELMWRMLTQWKAVLIVALAFAVLVSSVMYVKDMKTYQANLMTEAKTAEKASDIDKAIEEILSDLPESARASVEQAIVYDDIIAAKQSYLLKSLLVNLNTDEALTLTIGYVFTDVEDNSMQSALTSGYSSAFQGDRALKEIRDAMGVDSRLRYIKELISVEGYVDPDMAGVVKVAVTCPDAKDEESVAKAIRSIVEHTNKSLSRTVIEHRIKRIYVNSTSASPETVATAKSAAYNDLYNLQNVQRGHTATFTEEQKAAYEEIKSLKANVALADDATKDTFAEQSEELSKPGFSSIYAIAGFLLGIILYLGIYIVWQILSRRVDNVGAARNCTSTRLLGEYYYRSKRTRLQDFLFHSRVVTKHRYGAKMNLKIQAVRISDEISASCKNKNSREVSLVQMFDPNRSKEGMELLAAIENQLDVTYELIRAFPIVEGLDFANQEYVVFFISNRTEFSIIENVISLCADYNVEKIGMIFLGEV